MIVYASGHRRPAERPSLNDRFRVVPRADLMAMSGWEADICVPPLEMRGFAFKGQGSRSDTGGHVLKQASGILGATLLLTTACQLPPSWINTSSVRLATLSRSEMPPSSMETISGVLRIKSGGCIYIEGAEDNWVLVFPTPSSITKVTGNYQIVSTHSNMTSDRSYVLTGSTMGQASSSALKMYGVREDCAASRVFLFNGILEAV